jgi:hypothetical protein
MLLVLYDQGMTGLLSLHDGRFSLQGHAKPFVPYTALQQAILVTVPSSLVKASVIEAIDFTYEGI